MKPRPIFNVLITVGLLGGACGVALAAAETVSTASVLSFGADPTGVRDSSGAFQAALDRGGAVEVPTGTYLIRQTLSLTRSGTSVAGRPGAVMTFPAGFLDSGLVAKAEPFGLTNIAVRNLTLLCDKANYTPGKDGKGAFGIQLFGVDGAVVEACAVEGFTFTEIGAAAVRNVRILRCATVGGRHGISANGHIGNPKANGTPFGCSNVVIEGCRVTQTWDTLIAIGLCARDVQISGCFCEGSAAHGIDVFNSENVTVAGNRIANWLDPRVLPGYCEQAVGVFVHCDWGVSATIPTRNIVVKDNVLVRDPFPDGVRPIGVNIAGTVTGATISGNVVRGGLVGCAVSDVKDGDKRYGPQDIAFSNNVVAGQRLTLTVDGAAAMGVLFANNVFSPVEGRDPVAHVSDAVGGVRFANNAGPRDRFPPQMLGDGRSGAP